MSIDFYIKEIIKDKIILTQILKESLWDNIKNGQRLTGKVKDVKQFGALVQLDDETIGLVHISELEKSKRVVKAGDSVNIKVLLIDRSSRKIFLSITD
jgi:predicted RNA-binding protein with RPS1 domain